jgi:hypothetical protein
VKAGEIISRKIAARKSQESRPKPRRTPAEREKAARMLRKGQPLKVVPLRRGHQGVTIADAYEFIVAHDGTVEAGPDGALIFRLPARLDATGTADIAVRRKLEHACEVLDECRNLVHARLASGEQLPDARPALGGGVVE